jgi:Tol biopolymer transport system component
MGCFRSSIAAALAAGLLLALLAIALASPASAAEPVRLTDDGRLKFAPVFADADHIVFATHETPTQVVLMRLSLADGTQQRVDPNVAAHQFDPAYSRDGRFHAHVLSSGSPQLVLVMQDLTTKEEFTYRPREARATARGPRITPDGDRVVFSLSDVDGHRIASVDLQGGDLRLLTDATGANTWPDISPDGQIICFSSSRAGDFDLYLMDADGGNPRPLVESPGMDTRPAWSPDGRRIAFTSNRDLDYEIYIADAAGGGARRITTRLGKDDYALWHPDGRRLVIVSEVDGKSDLWMVEVD